MSWETAELKISKFTCKQTERVNVETLWKLCFSSYSALSLHATQPLPSPAAAVVESFPSNGNAASKLHSHHDFYSIKTWHSSMRRLLSTISFLCVCMALFHLWSPREELLSPCVHRSSSSHVTSVCSMSQCVTEKIIRGPGLTSFMACFFASFVCSIMPTNRLTLTQFVCIGGSLRPWMSSGQIKLVLSAYPLWDLPICFP